MTDKYEILKKFSEQVDFFCNFISNLFPDNIELKGQIGAFKLLNKSNSKQLNTLLYEYLKEYDQQIINSNEEFFIQLSYQEQNKYKEFSWVFDFLRHKLEDKKLMEQLCFENTGTQSDTNKQKIWKYIKVIYYLSKKYNNV
jgi:hypothetical protein